jgi:hypothetical protein
VLGEHHLGLEAGARGGRAGIVGLQPLVLLVLGQERNEYLGVVGWRRE